MMNEVIPFSVALELLNDETASVGAGCCAGTQLAPLCV